jgi:hypothetical protein
MLGRRYSGFSVHNQVRVPAEDAEGRKKLAGYMLRAPLLSYPFTKLRGEVELVAPGTLPNDGKVIDDTRKYS